MNVWAVKEKYHATSPRKTMVSLGQDKRVVIYREGIRGAGGVNISSRFTGVLVYSESGYAAIRLDIIPGSRLTDPTYNFVHERGDGTEVKIGSGAGSSLDLYIAEILLGEGGFTGLDHNYLDDEVIDWLKNR